MKRALRTLQALALHAATIVALYFGLVQGIDGAVNVGLFLVWAQFVIAMAGVSQYEKVKHLDVRHWPVQWLMWPFRLTTLALLVWYGHWLAGAACMLAIISTAALYAGSMKHRSMAA